MNQLPLCILFWILFFLRPFKWCINTIKKTLIFFNTTASCHVKMLAALFKIFHIKRERVIPQHLIYNYSLDMCTTKSIRAKYSYAQSKSLISCDLFSRVWHRIKSVATPLLTQWLINNNESFWMRYYLYLLCHKQHQIRPVVMSRINQLFDSL